VRVLLEAPASSPSPASGEIWDAIVAALGRGREPVVPVFIGGISDSRWFRERGIAAYGLLPFPIEGMLMRTVHGPDERMPLDAFSAGIERTSGPPAATACSSRCSRGCAHGAPSR